MYEEIKQFCYKKTVPYRRRRLEDQRLIIGHFVMAEDIIGAQKKL
ncbi:1732_t:CDS:2 [Funneliformis mosseae]|uniref:1732_t:CDS:1 n=1 Tax=Funneliformis mosseae TaxID=27381 RepID=A0A9N9GZX4_FUNMO|nr:1732_t:CDS:2 [Funneliformis mosseae]